MALMPYTRMSQDFLQPGARGEMFVNNGIPGHRTDDHRINRSNNSLNINDHNVLNFKYGLDPRLPAQFRYGWAYGYNQMVIPKGRICAADPHLMVMDTDTSHYFNAVTIANGGKPVRLAQSKDFQTGGQLEGCAKIQGQLQGKVWVELKEVDGVVVESEEVLKNFGGNVGVKTNAAAADTTAIMRTDVRPANVPVGILERNEYTRDADAFNGITFGPIRTDALVELPWFLSSKDAMANPWGSVVGAVKPGDLVCSDENGRFTLSPLSKRHEDHAAVMADMELYEEARRQVVGEVYATDATLLPEGAARYAQWALSDRMNFHDFHPHVYPTSNRDGEDFVKNPPTLYQSDFKYPGYPYDRTYMTNDLHMLASSREGLVDPRFDEAHRLDRGIPGLTDGYNAVIKAYGSSNGASDSDLTGEATLKVASVGILATGDSNLTNPERREILIKIPDTNTEAVKIDINDGTFKDTAIIIGNQTTKDFDNFEIVYADLHKGLVGIKQKENGGAEKSNPKCPVLVAYVKRGEAGIPTNLDWEGVQGTVRILMNK